MTRRDLIIEAPGQRSRALRWRDRGLTLLLWGAWGRPVDAVARCIDLPDDGLCRACITGEYPTRAGEQMYQLSLRKHANGDADGRTYERPTEPLMCSVDDVRS